MYRTEKSPWARRLEMPAVDDLGIMKHKRVFVLYKLAARVIAYTILMSVVVPVTFGQSSALRRTINVPLAGC